MSRSKYPMFPPEALDKIMRIVNRVQKARTDKTKAEAIDDLKKEWNNPDNWVDKNMTTEQIAESLTQLRALSAQLLEIIKLPEIPVQTIEQKIHEFSPVAPIIPTSNIDYFSDKYSYSSTPQTEMKVIVDAVQKAYDNFVKARAARRSAGKDNKHTADEIKCAQELDEALTKLEDYKLNFFNKLEAEKYSKIELDFAVDKFYNKELQMQTAWTAEFATTVMDMQPLSIDAPLLTVGSQKNEQTHILLPGDVIKSGTEVNTRHGTFKASKDFTIPDLKGKTLASLFTTVEDDEEYDYYLCGDIVMEESYGI